MPPSRSRDDLAIVALSRDTISEFLQWAAGIPTCHKEVIREQIASVADDDALVGALCEELIDLREADAVRHFLLLSTIGEMRNPVAVPSLVKLIWLERDSDPGRNRPTGSADLAAVDMLIGLQARAAEMLAYIGGEDADEAVLAVVARHPATAVRIAAIDGYLFNHDDASEAYDRLHGTAQPADGKLIGLPRFRRDGDPREFEARVRDFYDANRDERPPIPATEPPPRRGVLPRGDVVPRGARRLT